ncbi:MAG: serine hydrolase domain-containing protein [Finegoldia magna]|nr:serine hydrolase domain-containing protein [Finegoldia magna]
MKRNIWVFIIITLCVVLLSSENSYAKESYNRDEDIKKIEENIDNYVDKYKEGLVSCQIAVFNGDRISLEKTYGYKNIENKALADFDTVYDWGSSSKLLVWVSVMQLYEEGKIDLDEDIRVYLPDEFFKKDKI